MVFNKMLRLCFLSETTCHGHTKPDLVLVYHVVYDVWWCGWWLRLWCVGAWLFVGPDEKRFTSRSSTIFKALMKPCVACVRGSPPVVVVVVVVVMMVVVVVVAQWW